MEPRAALIAYDASRRQLHRARAVAGREHDAQQFAAYTNLGEDKFRVEIKDVGGGFGQRSTVYPEYCVADDRGESAGPPVKWVSTRTESFLSDTHGRGNIITASSRSTRTAVPRPAHRLDRRHGRVSVARRPGRPHSQPHDLHDRRLQDSRAVRTFQSGVDQHRAGRGLSRRGPARHRVRDRARWWMPRRANSTSTRRSCAAATSFRQRVPVQDPPTGSTYEMRRSAGAFGQGAQARRLDGFRSAPRCQPRKKASCAASACRR